MSSDLPSRTTLSGQASNRVAPLSVPKATSRERFRLLDWLFAAVVVQTILYNPTLGDQGSLTIYLSAITWPVVGVPAFIRWINWRDKWFLGAINALSAAALGLFFLLLVHLWVEHLQTPSIEALLRLLYLPIATVTALAVYRTIDRHIDIAIMALAAKDLWLIFDLLPGPIDLLHRLNPPGLGGFNVFGAFSAFLVVLRVSMWILRSRRPSPIVGGALAICAMTIFFTFSRSAFLALLTGLGLAATLRAPGRRHNWLAIGLMIVALAAIPFVAGEPMTTRLTQLSVRASSGREIVWRAAWEGFMRSPFVGNGFGSFIAYSPYVFMDGRNYTSSTHNLVLQILYEGGIVGLVAVTGGVWLVLRRCWSPVILPTAAAILMDSLFSTFPWVIQVSWILGVVASLGLHDRFELEARAQSSDRLEERSSSGMTGFH